MRYKYLFSAIKKGVVIYDEIKNTIHRICSRLNPNRRPIFKLKKIRPLLLLLSLPISKSFSPKEEACYLSQSNGDPRLPDAPKREISVEIVGPGSERADSGGPAQSRVPHGRRHGRLGRGGAPPRRPRRGGHARERFEAEEKIAVSDESHLVLRFQDVVCRSLFLLLFSFFFLSVCFVDLICCSLFRKRGAKRRRAVVITGQVLSLDDCEEVPKGSILLNRLMFLEFMVY